MNKIVRWILVVPAALAAAAAVSIVLMLVWYVTSRFNIVSHDDVISVGLATIGTNVVPAWAAVNAGVKVAPVNTRAVRIGVGAVIAGAAIVLYVLGLSFHPYASMLWHTLGTIAWVIGAAMGVVGSGKPRANA